MFQRLTLSFFFTFIAILSFAQGTETFTNIPASSSTYTTQNWTGDNGLPWSATDARTDGNINGRAITIRNGSVISNNIPNGISTLSFKHQQVFTGSGGALQVYINSVLIGTVNPTTTAATASFPGLAVSGSFNLEIRQTTAGLRIAIDDVTWTGNNGTPCTEPAAQPTSLNFTSTPTTVSGSYTAPNPASDGYLVVRSTSPTLSASPVDGITYSVGQAFGGGTVVDVTSATSFSDAGLTGSTTYYYFVFAYYDQSCSGGPNYLNINPLTSSTATQPVPACVTPGSAPTGLSLTPSNTNVVGTFSGVAGANRYLTIRSLSSTLSATPVNGTIYTAGQSFGGGTVVSYSSVLNFNASGLSTATTYYFFVFAANAECTGEPYYNSSAATGSTTTTNSSTGIPAGYYDAASGLSCQPLKTALKNITTNGYNSIGYNGLWSAYQYTDIHRNDANTANIIYDIYTDDPAGPETFEFTYNTNQCGSYNSEGDCYNREHTTPQSWFNSASPMVSDIHHILPTDGWVNGKRSNYPYGNVTSATFTSIDNRSKLGTGNNYGYTSTVFEPNAYFKGDLARIAFYMATRYENEIISQNWAGGAEADRAMLTAAEQPDAAQRRLQIYETWYLKTLFDWNNADPVSQKEIDRNNAIYTQSGQNNRNPFVDHPEYAAMIWQCTGVIPVTLIDFIASKKNESVLLTWYATYETSFKNYAIERSTDGITFEHIGDVAGQNLANYSFTDNALPVSSIVYYRLKMVDIDGKFKYSKIVTARLNNNFSNAIAYPNPTSAELRIKMENPLAGVTTVQVIDLSGRIVQQQVAAPGAVNVQIDVRKLPAGRYFVKMINGKELINQSFIISR